MSSTHLSSRSTCKDSVSPVAMCTLRMSSNFWSRDITEITSPALFHCTDVRYSNASASQTTSVERFCRSMMCSEVRALLVPANGYLRVCGSSVGCDGSAIVMSSMGELSTRSTTSASLFGDHQYPRCLFISSAATNSATPHVTSVAVSLVRHSSLPCMSHTYRALPRT